MKTNNRQYLPPTKNQGFPNDCQSNGFATIYETLHKRATGQRAQLSRTWLYGQGFRHDGLTPDLKSAPSMAAVQAVAEQQGVPLEYDWPYMETYIHTAATEHVKALAHQRRASHSFTIQPDPYNGVEVGQQVRASLAQGYLVGVSFKLRAWFRDLTGPENTHLAQAYGDQTHTANHFVVVIDCDDNFPGFVLRVVNCVGSGFGCPEDDTALVSSNWLKDAITITCVRGFAGHTDRFTYDADGIPGQVYRLYRAAFDRLPDKGGMGYHIDNMARGVTLADVASQFIASPEFQSKYGALGNRAFVELLYRNVLHRPGDAGGIDFHTANLDAGRTARHDTLVSFSASPEYYAKTVAVFEAGVAYT